jgi:Na+/melibiose symporter-like transporter
MASINGTQMKSDISNYQQEHKDSENTSKLSTRSIIMNDSTIIRNIICMVCIFVSNSSSYYMMGYMLKYFRGDIFVNNLVNGVTEFLTHLFAAKLVQYFGVKRTLMVTYLISIGGMAGFLLTNTMD